ncbi:hypothetical protein JCM17846_08590 [Iodidimonas nitroreducens]|uniref:DUF2065 domain-containing protein n=1 Tax=Iodidimonas nitroreducens TaxID=1236968 RepID=A0A5A7N5C9_9PROT|nr:DUF2065 domain-containing protein [Iodidimonas nitroreducens]GAK32383.1 hypothetical protein AQ1_00247 [alpha proteobacterium Q-1]GER03177.1 hypothetical protein JCM17846_08590 [Iodidimonas nitroreducens]
MSFLWTDFVVALGLAFVLEGVAYILMPDQMRRLHALVLSSENEKLRLAGIGGLLFGFVMIWVGRF